MNKQRTNWLDFSLAWQKSASGRRRIYAASRPPTMAFGGAPTGRVADYVDSVCAGGKWFWYPIRPVAKPRMTRRDRWQRRPCVMQYRDFRDCCKHDNVVLPDAAGTIVFCMPMPKSWSQRKQAEMHGEMHRQTPDIDNLIKAVMDASRDDDRGISSISGHKIWSVTIGFYVIWPRLDLDAKAAREVC